ncbi:MAG: gamma-glutamyltransferase [Myxococcota bacterium]|nr:gamma-glutamyltransferase [Myxococcota bacterium]
MKRFAAAFGIVCFTIAAAPPPLWAPGGMVASDHPLASEAGASILQEGGNAVDAAVATALAAGVVQPAGSGIGGGGFAVFGSSPQEMGCLDFREVAPAAAHPGLFLDSEGNVVPGASTKTGLAVGVPGEGRGLAQLLRDHGRMSPREVARPAVRLAKHGFVTGEQLLKAVASAPMTSLFQEGSPGRGQTVRRPRLARTLKKWASSSGEALYTGDIAADIVEATQAAGGILERADLEAYQPVEREPLVADYRGYTVVTMPPPSSGGAVLLQVLKALEGHDVASLGHNSSEHLHLLAEYMQHAYADRAAVMGDPAFTDVPVDSMLSEDRILAIRGRFVPDRTLEREVYGGAVSIPEDGGTHHLSVLDSEGFAVALTTTINTFFGSEVVAPRSGIVLNNQMDDFVAKPGVPNTYGLIGRAANAVEPGKKPLSSMTPTVVFKDGDVVLVVGASGGPFIISSTLQAISNVVDFGMTAEEAVSVPRMHHQWVPELLFVDEGIPVDVVRRLEERGHEVRQMAFFSAVQLIQYGNDGFFGAADPRKGGRPAGAGL